MMVYKKTGTAPYKQGEFTAMILCCGRGGCDLVSGPRHVILYMIDGAERDDALTAFRVDSTAKWAT